MVIPIHNGIDYTLKFLKSLEKVTYPNYEIIIVDDGSTDGSSDKIFNNFPKVTIIHGDGNLWWSGATNKGVEYAIKNNADYILTINNDVEVEPDFLTELVKCAQNNPKALIGSKINYIDDKDKVWYMGSIIDRERADVIVFGGIDDKNIKEKKAECLTGMSMLVPISVFEEIGFFDAKNFPQYLADSDFSIRAKNVGYDLIVTPKSTVYVDVNSSWSVKQRKKIKLNFIFNALFSIRSAYNISIRYKFYKRHWGKGYIRALLKLYYLYFFKFIKLFFKKRKVKA
jgi:GT2 family glycosyltransferase